MSEADKEKWRSIGVLRKRGQKEKVPVIDEDTGKVGGYHTKHWDGKQDANIFAKPIAVKGKTREGQD
jgi:hypothetical protein